MEYRCEIVARLPRGRCSKCDYTWRVRPLWEGKAGGFSKAFEAFALLLLREMAGRARRPDAGRTVPTPLAALAQACGRGVCRGAFSAVSCVGVDEMAVRKGHMYPSVFADLVRRPVLFAAEERDAGVFPQFILSQLASPALEQYFVYERRLNEYADANGTVPSLDFGRLTVCAGVALRCGAPPATGRRTNRLSLELQLYLSLTQTYANANPTNKLKNQLPVAS